MLAQQVRTALDAGFQDERATKAAVTAQTTPTVASVEELATTLIRYTPLQTAFVEAVTACNRLCSPTWQPVAPW